jgi:hypothetical protein
LKKASHQDSSTKKVLLIRIAEQGKGSSPGQLNEKKAAYQDSTTKKGQRVGPLNKKGSSSGQLHKEKGIHYDSSTRKR